MTWGTVAIAGASLVGGVIAGSASKSAANTQANAAQNSANTQLQMFNTVNEQQAPWRQAGETALNSILAGFDPTTGQFVKQFGPSDLQSNLAPNYAWQLSQGQGAVTNQANAAGGIGGNSLKAINDYTQNFAGNAYQQAFQNYNAQRGDIFNRLASIAGIGQVAGSASATGAPTFASGIGQSISNVGAANAAGIVGQANAYTGAANNAMGWYALNNFMNPNASGGMYSGGNSGAGPG